MIAREIICGEGTYVDIRYADNVTYKMVRRDQQKIGVEYRGYLVQQSPYSRSILVEKDGRLVVCYYAHTNKTHEELKTYVDSYIELMEDLLSKSGLKSIEIPPDSSLIRDFYEKRMKKWMNDGVYSVRILCLETEWMDCQSWSVLIVKGMKAGR